MKQHSFISILIAAVIVLLLDAPAAKDLGVRGAVWPVVEPDLLTEIENRLETMKASGELARMRRESLRSAKERVEAPPRVAGIRPAHFIRIRRFDPSITIERNIFAHDGALLAARGTRINPLKIHPLTRDLLFIDGTRQVEVAWAIAREKPSVVILLAGRPLELMRAYGRAFFFDQGGRLAMRFGLLATPSVVVADGDFLRITEIPLEDEESPESKEDKP